MTGEMSKDDLKDYPEMINLKKILIGRGFEVDMHPFDKYQGPFLFIGGIGAIIWHDDCGNWDVDQGHLNNRKFMNHLRTEEVIALLTTLKQKIPRTP